MGAPSLKKSKKNQTTDQRRPVLIIQHAHYEHPAVIRRALETQGIQTLWLHPYRGEKYPKVSEIRGLISLGGPMGANDEKEHPWILKEIELLKAAAEKNLPTVGVCLGGQMLARALGGKVEKNHIAEVGWFPIQLNLEGKKDKIVGNAGENPVVYHWHNDTFHPPKEAMLLAGSEHCARQAYRIGDRIYGFQFHPEADHQLIHEWLSVEGVEDEILESQKLHGSKTVQDAQTQKINAIEGEKFSLKITAAIGQLFKDRSYAPVAQTMREQFGEWANSKALLVIEFESSDRRPLQLKGHIISFLSIPDGEFLIFREENTILWPIRLDYIRKILF